MSLVSDPEALRAIEAIGIASRQVLPITVIVAPPVVVVNPPPTDLAFCDRCNMRPCYCPMTVTVPAVAVEPGR